MQRIEFTTDEFPPYLPEASQQNPGVYGFELAHWLSQELAERGVITSYPVGEDWGWFIEFIEGETEIMISCGSESREGDGYTGKPISWRVFVKQSISIKKRFKGVVASPKVEELATLVASALKSHGVHAVVTEA